MKKNMQKIKLLDLGKSEHHNHYTFPKQQKVLKIIRQILGELGFAELGSEAFGRPLDKTYGDHLYEQEESVKTYIDRRFSYENKEYFVEIIFSKSKVFVGIHTEKDRQQEVAKIMGKFFLE